MGIPTDRQDKGGNEARMGGWRRDSYRLGDLGEGETAIQ